MGAIVQGDIVLDPYILVSSRFLWTNDYSFHLDFKNLIIINYALQLLPIIN